VYLAFDPDVAESSLKLTFDLRIELRNAQRPLFLFVEK
jgi:hypothetical protein